MSVIQPENKRNKALYLYHIYVKGEVKEKEIWKYWGVAVQCWLNLIF